MLGGALWQSVVVTPGERLAKAVRDRRLALGDLTQAQVAERGGPSTETLRLIENARQPRFGDRTLLRLDRALSWPSGTSAKILEGTATEADLNTTVVRPEGISSAAQAGQPTVTTADDPRAAVVTVTEIVARLAAQRGDPEAEDALGRLRRILPALWGERPEGS